MLGAGNKTKQNIPFLKELTIYNRYIQGSKKACPGDREGMGCWENIREKKLTQKVFSKSPPQFPAAGIKKLEREKDDRGGREVEIFYY